MENSCDICGNVGVVDAIVTCSQCKVNCEHPYCMRTYTEKIPNVWFCEDCGPGNEIDPLRSPSEPKKGCNKQEKIPGGKTKFIPVGEAIQLTSGAHSSKHPMKITERENPISSRTPVKPKAKTFTDILQHRRKSPPLGSSDKLLKLGNDNPLAQHQVMQSEEEPKGKIPDRCLVRDFLKEQAGTAPKHTANDIAAQTRLKERATDNPSALFSRPTRSPCFSTSGGAVSVKELVINSGDGNTSPVSILPNLEYAFHPLWNGKFNLLNNCALGECIEGIQAYPPSTVYRKVYEFSKTLPEVLELEFVRREDLWSLFGDDIPGHKDVGLYFFPRDVKRSERYISLLEFIGEQDLVMRLLMNNIELLILTSKLLRDCQRWNGEYYLWGIFHSLKNDSSCAGNDNELLDMEIDAIGGQNCGRLDKVIQEFPGTESATVKEEIINEIPPGFESIPTHPTPESGQVALLFSNVQVKSEHS